MSDPLSVWAALSDDALEKRLRQYYPAASPNIYKSRFAALAEEANRRGKPEMVQRAKEWVERSKVAPLS